MKLFYPSLLLILAYFLCIHASAQDIIYTISGEINSQKTSLDSIAIENLSKQSVAGFGNLPVRDDYRINLSRNEYLGSTSATMLKNESGLYLIRNMPGTLAVAYRGQKTVNANISLHNINGQRLALKENQLLENGSLVELEIGLAGIYFLTISTPMETRSFKATGLEAMGSMNIATQSGAPATLKSGPVYTLSGTGTEKGDNVKVSVFKEGYVAQPVELIAEENKTLVFPLEAQTPPEVQTLAATNIASNSAILNGNVESNGNSTITERGFFWSSINENPGEADNKIVVEGTTGSFSAELSGLEHATPYYVRAYAINEIGTSYGETESVIIIENNIICDALDNCDLDFKQSGNTGWYVQTEYSHFRGAAIRSSDKIKNNQLTSIETIITGPILLSFWWKVSSENGYDKLNFYIDSTLKDNISGNIDWQLKEFEIPEGVHIVNWTYIKDPESRNGLDCGFLDKIVLTSIEPTLPSVTTKNVEKINSTTAISGGEITSTGNAQITVLGICWNTSGNPTISDDHSVNDKGTGSWAYEMKDLLPSTKYYIRAYATNSQGTTYGSQISFTTLPFTSICEAVDNCDISFSLKGDAEWFSQANQSYSNGTSLQSGKIGHYKESIIETEVTGPGYLTFWCKVSSEKNSDGLGFFINNNRKKRISGDVDWQIKEFDIPEGKQILKWEYSKDGSRNDGFDCAWLDKIEFTNTEPTLPTVTTSNITNIEFNRAESGGEITSRGNSSITACGICWNTTGFPTIKDSTKNNFSLPSNWSNNMTMLQAETTYYVRAFATNAKGTAYGEQKSFTTPSAITLCEAIDNCDLTFTHSGDAEWTAYTDESYYNGSSARSGLISHKQQSTLETTVNGPGIIRFYWKVSSESARDKLNFYIGYSLKDYISDEVNWELKEYEISEGKNILKWRYTKDNSISDGNDCGSIDKLEFTHGEPTLPTLSNVIISDINCNSAFFKSDVTNSGNAIITERGFYFYEAGDSTNRSRVTGYSGKGLSVFDSSASYLTPETKYYVRAYATNKVGTAYSDFFEFTTLSIDLPQVETLFTDNVSQTTATVAGTITSNGGGNITESGICFNITGEPTLTDSVIFSNNKSGDFVVKISNLTSGVVYYVRSFATNGAGTTYGKTLTFKTLNEFPLCEALENCVLSFSSSEDAFWFSKPDDLITGNWIAQSGAIEDLQSSNLETNVVGPGKIQFNWRVSSENAVDLLCFYLDDKILANISGLTDWQHKEIDIPEGIHTLKWSYQKNNSRSKGDDCGWVDKIAYTPKELSLPIVTTTMVSSITQNSASVSGKIESTGNAIITSRGICWSTSEDPTLADRSTNEGTSSLNFSSSLTDLEPKTTYFVRAYATNSQGTAYGEQMIVTTAEVRIPQVSVMEFYHLSQAGASCKVSATSTGFTNITARGLCWNTTGEPTINDNISTNGSGTGSWISEITNLIPETTYYLKAYASYENGTEYSSQYSFKTPKTNETGQFTDPRDGNVYNTVKIGSQIWMAENLKYLPQVSPISLGSDDEKHYYIYDYEGSDVNQAKATEKYKTFGALYNWTAALDGQEGSITNPSNLQGVCTAGWHLPSNAEWEQLSNYLADNGYNHDGSLGGGGDKIAKALSAQEYWYDIDRIGSVGSDLTKNNSSGFSALPGGERSYTGDAGYYKQIAYFWSASEISSLAYNAEITYDYDNLIVSYQWAFKNRGLSVRCVKDYEAPLTLPTVSGTEVTEISQTEALFSSYVATSNLENITEKGFVWNTTGEPDLNDNAKKMGAGEGMINFKPNNLIVNTTYYVRSFAMNDLGIKYGEVSSFKTLDSTPICEAVDNCELTFTNSGNAPWFGQSDEKYFGVSSAQSGYIGNDQFSNLETEVTGPGVISFYWKISASYFHKLYFYVNQEIKSEINGAKDWELITFDLPEGTHKISWKFSKNYRFTEYKDCAWIDKIVYTQTAVSLPKINFYSIANIKPNSATVYANVESDGFSNITARGYCWNTAGNPTTNDNNIIIKGTKGSLTGLLGNLLPNTTYYVRAFATNSAGTGYSQQITFTAPIYNIPTISTNEPSDIFQYSAKTGGSVISNGYAQITSCGVCWNTTGEPTIHDNKTSDTFQNETWESNLVGLVPNTTYYTRAYAINNEGTGYGEIFNFKTPDISIPTVTASKVTYITQNSAVFEGVINSNGGVNLTERGFCWNTNGNPTLNDSKTIDNLEPDHWTYALSGLGSNTTYYVRAYAKNNKGTAYSEQIAFKTHNEVSYGNLIDQRDGKSYKTVQMGEQTWMAENLAYLPQVYGPSYASETVEYYYVYGYNGNSVSDAKSTINYQTYGVLYNWPAAMQGAGTSESTPSEVQGVCPSGWHLPSDVEWIELFDYFADNGFSNDSYTPEGKKQIAKYMAAKTNWLPSTDEGAIGNNLDINNTSGFSALPGGCYKVMGNSFLSLTESGNWWSTSREYGWSDVKNIELKTNSSTYTIAPFIWDFKNNGYSVRCVKD